MNAAGVCPAIHVRLERRRAAANAVVRAAARRLRGFADALVRGISTLAHR
jgi:hypothetical protein